MQPCIIHSEGIVNLLLDISTPLNLMNDIEADYYLAIFLHLLEIFYTIDVEDHVRHFPVSMC